jgi:hypothetical protein
VETANARVVEDGSSTAADSGDHTDALAWIIQTDSNNGASGRV